MTHPLSGKCALITGSTSGLGLAAARRFAAAGCNVVLHGLEPPPVIEGASTLHSAADLSRPDEIAALIDAAQSAFGTIDILVNNAVTRHAAPIEDFSVAAWDQGIAVNLSAAFHTIRLALPGMRRRGWGRIINVGSVYSLFAAADRVAYVTTKTALIGLTRAVALETVGQDITVNAICPGTAETPVHEARIAAMATADGIAPDVAAARFLSSKQPTRRFIGPDGVAGLMLFLCGPDGADITGAALPVDGGWSAS